MHTVTARPAYGSVTYYVDLLGDGHPSDSLVVTLVRDLATDPHHEGSDRLDGIRNLLAAVEQIREARR